MCFVLFVVTTGEHFTGTPNSHKIAFQQSSTRPIQLSVPLGWLSPTDCPLCPFHPSHISWKETFIGQDDGQQTCTLASGVINCNVFRLVVFSKAHSLVVSIVKCSSSFTLQGLLLSFDKYFKSVDGGFVSVWTLCSEGSRRVSRCEVFSHRDTFYSIFSRDLATSLCFFVHVFFVSVWGVLSHAQ